jgi:hypothetical protein
MCNKGLVHPVACFRSQPVLRVCHLVCLQPNLLTAPADDRWKAIRKAVAVSFSAQVRPAEVHTHQLSQLHTLGHRHGLAGGNAVCCCMRGYDLSDC